MLTSIDARQMQTLFKIERYHTVQHNINPLDIITSYTKNETTEERSLRIKRDTIAATSRISIFKNDFRNCVIDAIANERTSINYIDSGFPYYSCSDLLGIYIQELKDLGFDVHLSVHEYGNNPDDKRVPNFSISLFIGW